MPLELLHGKPSLRAGLFQLGLAVAVLLGVWHLAFCSHWVPPRGTDSGGILHDGKADAIQKTLQAESPMFRGSPARTGYYPGALFKRSVDQKHKSILFAGSTNGHVYAWDARTGHELWSQYLGAKILTSPAVVGGTVYVGTSYPVPGATLPSPGQTGYMVALDALTGRIRWEVETGRWIRTSPGVADGVLYVGTDDGCLYALSALTGKRLWKAKLGSLPIAGSPAVVDGTVYAGVEDLRALDAKTGKVLWKVDFEDPYPGHPARIRSPAVVNGVIYVTTCGGMLGGGGRYEAVVAVDAKTGDKVWVSRGVGVMGSPAVADGIVYVLSCDCRLYALQAATGEELWQVNTYKPTIVVASGMTCTPVIKDGVVYVSGRGCLFALGAKTGDELWKVEITGHGKAEAATIANGVLYTGTYRFGCDAGPASTMSSPLLAIEAETGKTLWQVTDKGGFYSAPAVADCLP